MIIVIAQSPHNVKGLQGLRVFGPFPSVEIAHKFGIFYYNPTTYVVDTIIKPELEEMKG